MGFLVRNVPASGSIVYIGETRVEVRRQADGRSGIVLRINAPPEVKINFSDAEPNNIARRRRYVVDDD